MLLRVKDTLEKSRESILATCSKVSTPNAHALKMQICFKFEVFLHLGLYIIIATIYTDLKSLLSI